MAKLIIHPGSPKTATSLIQRSMENYREKYLGQKKAGQTRNILSIGDFRHRSIMAAFQNFYRDIDKGGNLQEEIEDYFMDMDEKYDLVIISEESFAHDFMPSRSHGFGGIDRAEKTVEFIERLPFSEKKVVLTIKNQIDLLVSTYTHFVHRNREQRNFQNWFNSEVNIEGLSWSKVIDTFESRMGADNISIIPFEIIKEYGPEAYVNEVFNEFHIDSKYIESISHVHNPSPSQRAVQVCRVINKEVWNRSYAERMNTCAVETFSNEEFGKYRPKQIPSDKIISLYETENYELARRKFPDYMSCFKMN